MPADFLQGIALALAVGMLIGVERGWRQRDKPAGSRVAGIRTFSLLGLLGGLAGLAIGAGLAPLGITLLAGAIVALLVGYRADIVQDDNVSATSTLAGVATLGLGALATTGHAAQASVGAGATIILLASRAALHRAIRLTSEEDLQALLRLVLVVFVILPLLPDRAMGPLDALNPQRLWFVVVVTGSISFSGYILARWLGQQRGALVAGAVGALVSSTAVTVDSARLIRSGSAGRAAHAAVAIASTVMLVRSLLLVGLIAPAAFAGFATLVLPGLGVSALGALVLVWSSAARRQAVDMRPPRPPGLALAFLFALSVAVLSLGSAWAQGRWGGDSGAILIAIGGIADIDASIAAIGALPAGTIAPAVAALALAAPTFFNTLFKLVLLAAIGGKRSLAGAIALASTSLALAAPMLATFLG